MPFLVVEENVRLKGGEDAGLRDAAHEECFINVDAPGPECIQYPKVRRNSPL